jgi:Trehalose receptor
MDRSLKLFTITKVSDQSAFESDKQLSSIEHRPEKGSNPAAIEINGAEGKLSKASAQQKFLSFHEALGPVLTGFLRFPFLLNSREIHSKKNLLFSVGQFFGNLPVEGVLDRDASNLSFKWLSLRTIYAVLYMVVGGLEVCLMVWKGFVKGFDILIAGEFKRIYM